MIEAGSDYGFLCTECGTGPPVEGREKVAADTGARPIARSMIRILMEQTDNHRLAERRR